MRGYQAGDDSHTERVTSINEPDSGAPAWQRATRGEPRWHVSLVVLSIIALQLMLPPSINGGFVPLVPLVELVLLVALFALNPRRIDRPEPWLRYLGLTLTVVISIANVVSMVRLISSMITGTATNDPVGLLGFGANVWITNVLVFALLFWELDRGGPVKRALMPDPTPDFLFPQMQLAASSDQFQDWEPRVLDYLYVSFTNATAFSPTDTMPLSRWAKVTMMIESAVSLMAVALVVARAVNILH